MFSALQYTDMNGDKETNGPNKYLPVLSLDDWEDSNHALHLFFQIVGKIKLALNTPRNYWWHIPLYVSSRGITTESIPYEGWNFSIDFDFIDDVMRITTSNGETRETKLTGLSLSDFYKTMFSHLKKLGIKAQIKTLPYDMTDISTQPDGLMDEALKPEGAFWNPDAGMALLMYNAIREVESPRDAVLDFLESA